MDWSSTAYIDWHSKDHVIALSGKVREYVHHVHGSVSERQKRWGDDPGVKGPTWVSRCTVPPPWPQETDLQQLLCQTIDALDEGNGPYIRPKPAAVEAQWTGHRAGVEEDAPEPLISEEEKYEALMNEVSNPVTIFYIYGGAFSLGGPARCRKYAAAIAGATKGRCFTVRYRLAPQYPFPAGLLDIFQAYMFLLAPPPGSYHAAVPPSSIVLTGDSSGASMALSLIQLLLTIGRNDWMPSARYRGENVPLSLPAGITGVSAAADHTLCLPSEVANAKYDVFEDGTRFTEPGFPLCDVWPTKPPRGHVYCESRMLWHPLVSPTSARDWTGSPPMWFVSGQDRSTDSVKIIMQMAARQGVCVLFEEYEAMPHSWPMLYATSPQSQKCFNTWARICVDLAKGERLTTRSVFVELKDMHEKETDTKNLVPLEIDDVILLMKRKAREFKTFTGEKIFIKAAL